MSYVCVGHMYKSKMLSVFPKKENVEQTFFIGKGP